MVKILMLFIAGLSFIVSLAQENLPTDYLTPGFHKGRREAFRSRMPANSVAIVFSYPEQVFSRDVNYAYHANPDLYYLTGYREPDALLLLFKENQQQGDTSYNEVIFVRKRNPVQEAWTGRRLGVEGVRKQLGFNLVYNGEDFKNFNIDFKKFTKLFYDFLPQDASGGSLSNLVKTFREKAGITQVDNQNLVGIFSTIARYVSAKNLPVMIPRLVARINESGDESIKNNPILLELMNKPDSGTLISVVNKIKSKPFPSDEYHQLIAALREIKTPEEMALMRKSVSISAIAHAEAMRAIEPDMSETALSGLFQYVHKKYGAEDEGYPPIVGAGANGCILHYIENNATRVNNQLVLMDVGSEYHGYSADITRTLPANGKFTEAQKAIYQLVYDAQEAVFKKCIEGTPFVKLNETATDVLAAGLLKLGIINKAAEVSKYYIHGCSHHLGLDVHDKSVTPILQENMVITVEPGIYIPKNSPCDPKWWDIAVRIEDDVVIGKTKCENLSIEAPRSVEAVEKMIAARSVFNQLVLPPIK